MLIILLLTLSLGCWRSQEIRDRITSIVPDTSLVTAMLVPISFLPGKSERCRETPTESRALKGSLTWSLGRDLHSSSWETYKGSSRGSLFWAP